MKPIVIDYAPALVPDAGVCVRTSNLTPIRLPNAWHARACGCRLLDGMGRHRHACKRATTHARTVARECERRKARRLKAELFGR